jgi:DNA (cytosine-5)-methyltransferase 1
MEVVINTLDEIGYNVFYKVLNASNYGAITSRERVYILAFRKDLGITEFDYPEFSFSNKVIKDILEKEVDDKYFIVRDDIYLKKNEDNAFFETLTKKPIQIGYINKGGQGERIYSEYGHAITLSAHGGGAAAKTGAYCISGKVRKLTPRECARIMGYPDNYIIPVSDGQSYKQFGNSVAVPVLKNIFKNVIKLDIWEKQHTDIRQNLVQVLQKEVLIMNKM